MKVKVKSWCLVKHCTMEPGGVVQSDAFVTTGINGMNAQLHAPAALHPEKKGLRRPVGF
jgi:hypothetical protein